MDNQYYAFQKNPNKNNKQNPTKQQKPPLFYFLFWTKLKAFHVYLPCIYIFLIGFCISLKLYINCFSKKFAFSIGKS